MLLDLDDIRDCIIGGRLDPQVSGAAQRQQFDDSVLATAALARSFMSSGYDVVITDVFYAEDVERIWLDALRGLPLTPVRLHNELVETLRRSQARRKQVQERWVRQQHASPAPRGWPSLDTSAMTVAEAADALEALIGG